MKNITPYEMSLLHEWLPTCSDRLPIEFDYDGNHYDGRFVETKVKRTIHDASHRTTHYEVKLTDSVILAADYTEYTDYPVCEWVFSFTNYGSERSKILTNAHISFSLSAESPKFIYGNGDTLKSDGYTFYETDLAEPLILAPADGTPCNGASPFMKLLTDEKSVRIAVGWPGTWKATVSKIADSVNITLGQKRLSTVILPGETIRTPSITLMAYTGDDNRGINMWRHWYFDHIMPNDKGHPLSSQMCLHYWQADGKPEFTAASEENQLRAIDSYLENGLNPDIWWIDAGWYPCDYDWTKIGSWYHDKKRFPNGLEPIGSKCREIGSKLLLWFEPERVREGSELDREHPEWLLKKHDGGDKLLDLGNPDALNWLCDRVNSLIKEYKVGIYRQDFNFNPLPIWCDNETDDRIGAIENAHVQGYLKYWDCLLFTNLGLIIDTCASGGRRNEMETLKRSIPLHYTDVGYGNHPIKQKQHRMMFEWIPYFRAHTMSWDDENGNYVTGVNRSTDEFALHCALTPAVTVMTTYDADKSEFKTVQRFEKVWRKAAEYMIGGDYYPLTECNADSSDWYAMRFDDSKTRTGFIQVIRNVKAEDDEFILDMKLPNDINSLTITEAFTGSMRVLTRRQTEAFQVSIPKRSGIIWFYEY